MIPFGGGDFFFFLKSFHDMDVVGRRRRLLLVSLNLGVLQEKSRC